MPSIRSREKRYWNTSGRDNPGPTPEKSPSSSLRRHLRALIAAAGGVLTASMVAGALLGSPSIRTERSTTQVHTDSSGTVLIHTPASEKRALRKSLARRARIPSFSLRRDLGAILDSLGFFASTRDSTGPDSVHVFTGPRSTVDSIGIQCEIPVPLDSLGRGRFPGPYDAGAVDALAGTVAYYLATRGYPFALVRIQPPGPCAGKESVSADSGGGLCITYAVTPDQRCVFGEARFIGDFTTRPSLLGLETTWHRDSTFDIGKVGVSTRRMVSRAYITSASTGPPRIFDENVSGPGTPGKDTDQHPPRVSIPIRVEDRSGLGLDGALGYESGAGQSGLITGTLDLSLLNVFGTGEAAMLRYEGDRTLQLFDMSVHKPWLGSLPLFGSAGFGLEVREEEYGYLHGMLETLVEIRPLWQAGLALKGHETQQNATAAQSTFYGGELILARLREPRRSGIRTHHLRIATGSGVARRSGRQYGRWHVDFTAGTHLPVGQRNAASFEVVSNTLVSREDTLADVELYRVGGHESVRGYTYNEFPLRSVFYIRSEFLRYFGARNAVYPLLDGGVGFRDKLGLRRRDRTLMLGYGLGARLPVRIGTVSVEWARNYRETRGFGRVHLRFRNATADAVEMVR